MKLKKSMLLSIALLGSSASIFSYAVVHNVVGSTADARGTHFKSLLGSVSSGDEIVFNDEVRLIQGEGNLNIPNVTIKGNNNILHLEGYNLNLTGDATFNNLKLSLVPTRTLSESFASFGNKGADAKPTLIVTNGNSLTLDAVSTKVEKSGENDGTRPIILLGGGNSSKPETLTISNSTTETKLYGISIDGKKSLNSNGELIENSSDSSSNAVTLNIGRNTNILGGISINDNDDININSKSSNLSKIDTGNTTNVNLTISEVSSVGASGVLNTNPNAKFKSLNLDGVVVTLQNGNPYSPNNISIDTLSLKDGGGIKSGNSFNEEDNLTVAVDNLKSEGNNTLTLDSGRLIVSSAEIKSGTLGFIGSRADLTFPDSIDTDDDGNYVPPKKAEDTLPQPPESPSTQPDSNDEESENSNSGTQPENQPSGPSNTENTGGDNSSTETDQPLETGTGESEGATETGETVGGQGEPPATNEDNSNVDNSKDEVDTTSDKSEESADDPNASSPTPSTEPSETTEELTNTEDKPSSPTNEASNGTNSENLGKDEESSNEGSSTDNPQDSDKEQPESQPPVATEESTPSTDNTVPPNAGTNEADTESSEKQNSTEDGKDQNSPSEKDEQSGNDQQGKDNQEQPSGVVDTNTEIGKSEVEVTDTEGTDTNSSDTSNESQSDNSNTEIPSIEGAENVTETPNASSDTEDSNKEPEGSSTGNEEADGETSVGEQPKNDKVEEPAENQPVEPKQDDSKADNEPKKDQAEELAESQPEEAKQEGSEVAAQPKDDKSKSEAPTESHSEESKQEGSEAAEQPKDDTVEEVTESKSEEPKKDDSEIAEKLKDDKAETPTESQPEESKQEGSAVVENPTELSNPSVNNNEGKADEKTDKPEMPIEKTAEKSIKDRIMDTLKGWFTSNKVDEKQQQQVVEKTEESLKNLVEMYTDYDFSFSFDATRVAENRLNELAMLNGLESAANNYAFLAQSVGALQNHNSVWVSSSLTEQRGDSKRRLNTINLGYDRQIDNLILGGFVSHLRQKGERVEISSKLHGYALSLYGKYNQNSHEVVALLNAGKTKADLQRNISAFGINNQADAKGKFVGVKVEYSYRMPFEAHSLLIKPLIALNYNLGRQAAFTERGTMPVHVDKIKAQRLAVEAGVELRKYFETAYVYVKPTIQTDVMARSNDVDIRFVDTPNSIPFKSVAKKKNYFALSLGTQLQLRKNLLLDLSANSRIGKHERDIQGSIKLNYKF